MFEKVGHFRAGIYLFGPQDNRRFSSRLIGESIGPIIEAFTVKQKPKPTQGELKGGFRGTLFPNVVQITLDLFDF